MERVFSQFTCEIKKIFVTLQPQSPDGGIGRRAGLKHQWGNPCRFDPGSGYKPWRRAIFPTVFLFAPTLERFQPYLAPTLERNCPKLAPTLERFPPYLAPTLEKGAIFAT